MAYILFSKPKLHYHLVEAHLNCPEKVNLESYSTDKLSRSGTVSILNTFFTYRILNKLILSPHYLYTAPYNSSAVGTFFETYLTKYNMFN